MSDSISVSFNDLASFVKAASPAPVQTKVIETAHEVQAATTVGLFNDTVGRLVDLSA